MRRPVFRNPWLARGAAAALVLAAAALLAAWERSDLWQTDLTGAIAVVALWTLFGTFVAVLVPRAAWRGTFVLWCVLAGVPIAGLCAWNYFAACTLPTLANNTGVLLFFTPFMLLDSPPRLAAAFGTLAIFAAVANAAHALVKRAVPWWIVGAAALCVPVAYAGLHALFTARGWQFQPVHCGF